MQSIAAHVNQDATSPTAGNSEWKLWLEFINRSTEEWAQAFDWEDLRKEYRPTITGLTQATIPLPQDFRKLASDPVSYGTSKEGGEEWPEIAPERQREFITTEKWVQIRGDISNGFNLIWNPGTLASGVTVAIQYFSIPTSLASPAQVPLVTDSQYIIDRTISFIFEARSDPRFQQQETKARDKLLLMVENANLAKYSSFAGPNRITNDMKKRSFRIGRD